jgi:Putative papain-like cysteine peptidase (DUF1796)
MKPAFDHIVSLGRSCQAAWHIRRTNGFAGTLPFDWVGSPDAAVRKSIATHLAGWFERDHLYPDPTGGYRNRETGIRFLHAFDKHPTFEAGYVANKDRMETLVWRWLDLIASDKTVLFVREHGTEPDPCASARLLVQTLLNAVNVGFELLYLVPPDRFDPDWQLDGVTFVQHHRDGPGAAWYGYPDEWAGWFRAKGFRPAVWPPVPEPARNEAEAAAEAERE